MRISAGHIIQPVFDKTDRKTQFFGKIAGQYCVLDATFHTVRPPDIHIVVNPDVVHRQAHRCGDLILILGHLNRRPDIQNFGDFIPFRHNTEGLDWHRRRPSPSGPVTDSMRNTLEVICNRTPSPGIPEKDIRSMIRVNQRLILFQHLFGIDRRRQRFVLDLDQLGCVFGNVSGVSDHRGNPFPSISGHSHREREPLHIGQVQSVK